MSKLDKSDRSIINKKNKSSGAIWERKVRADLEIKGWFVAKFQNNIEFKDIQDPNCGHNGPYECSLGKMIPAKRKYNPFNRALCIGTGFPDFICWKTSRFIAQIKNKNFDYLGKQLEKIKKQLSKLKVDQHIIVPPGVELTPDSEIIGVEAKSNGYLDKEEREKCRWLLKNKVFSKILIAKKKKEGRKVIPEYIDFQEKYLQEKKMVKINDK